MSELNIKSTTVEKGLDLAKDFLQRLVGPSIEEIGLLLSDNIRLWRVSNQLRNLEKVKRIVDEQNVDIKQINMKVLFPYLEAVALEDDEALQDLWANLFVNYIDSKRNLTLNVYPVILKQLSSNEVKILEFINENGGLQYYKILEVYEGSNRANKSITVNCCIAELVNLERLSLIKEKMVVNVKYDSVFEVNARENQEEGKYEITIFGTEFLKACHR